MLGEEITRAALIKGAGAVAVAGAAKPFSVAANAGKKVRIGVPLTYGPLNQPWRRGCGMMIKKILEMGGEPVTFRGEPTKASERNAEEQLLTRNIDALV
ncbi:MAG: sugar ABC transporter substrate-binding protein, partial [Candidatus Dormibacteria bacterium]